MLEYVTAELDQHPIHHGPRPTEKVFTAALKRFEEQFSPITIEEEECRPVHNGSPYVLVAAWSRGRWFRFDGLSRIAANARPVHLHVPFVHAVHPLLDSPIELLKLYGTVQK